MIKTYRLRNLLMGGGATGEELDEILSLRDYQGAMYDLCNDRRWMRDIAKSPLAVETLCNSALALKMIWESDNAQPALWAEKRAQRFIVLSDVALGVDAVRASVANKLISTPWNVDSSQTAVKNAVAMCRAPELGVTVAVGTGISYSTDGGSTFHKTNINTSGYTDVCWSPEKRLFLAVASSKIATSTDGITWIERNGPGAIDSICWSRKFGKFVGYYGPYTKVYASTDTLEWEEQSTTGGTSGYPFTSLSWSDETELFSAVCANQLHVSPNYVDWSNKGTGGHSGTITGAKWIDRLRRYVVIYSASPYVRTSLDLSTWITPEGQPATSGLQYKYICDAPELGVLAIAGTGSPLATPDMRTWTTMSFSPSSNPTWYGLCWDPSRRRFVGVDGGSAQKVMTTHSWEA